jgi:hypothetical protein
MESRHRFDQKSRPYGKISGRSAADRKDPQSPLREVASYLLLLASASEIAIEAASRSFGAAGGAITAPERLHPCPIISGHPNNDPGYPSRPDVDLRIIFVPLRIIASYSCSWISSRGSKAASSDTSSGWDGQSSGTRARAIREAGAIERLHAREDQARSEGPRTFDDQRAPERSRVRRRSRFPLRPSDRAIELERLFDHRPIKQAGFGHRRLVFLSARNILCEISHLGP